MPRAIYFYGMYAVSRQSVFDVGYFDLYNYCKEVFDEIDLHLCTFCRKEAVV